MMDQKFGLNEDQWDVLKAGPLHMLEHVGGADSHIDRDEWSAFFDAVAKSAGLGDELLTAVMSALAIDLKDEVQPVPAGARSGLDGLRAIHDTLALFDDEGRRYREALLELGATVAESSGSQLTRTFVANHGRAGWARSAGTSAAERAALESAAEALGLTS